MHELSVCQSLLDQVEAIAKQHQTCKVSHIVVHLGPLCGVEPELLMQAFNIARAGTFAEQAKLTIKFLPARIYCHHCGQEGEVSPNHLVCRGCGNWHTDLVSGDEMLLASVELFTLA